LQLPIADWQIATPNSGQSAIQISNRKCFWGHSLNENNHREVAKAEASYMPAPATVHLCKPARHRKVPFTGPNRWR